MKKICILSLLIFLIFQVAPQVPAQTKSVKQSVELKETIKLLLDAYSRKDIAGFMKFFADGDVLMMGTDRSEVATSKAEIEKLIADDYKLWDASRFGEIENYHADFRGKGASAFFDVSWEAESGGTKRNFVIRFATVWRESGGRWKLVQALNAVPTVGQSAEEIKRQLSNK